MSAKVEVDAGELWALRNLAQKVRDLGERPKDEDSSWFEVEMWGALGELDAVLSERSTVEAGK